MKNTPERIYLDIEDYHEFNYNIEYVNQHKQTDEDIEYIRKDIYDKDISDARIVEVAGMISEEECEAKEKDAYKKGSDDCHKAFVSSGHFTKEQVVELMKQAWGEGGKLYYTHRFEQWLEKVKPFDSK